MMIKNENPSNTYPSNSQTGYFIKSSSSYEKTETTNDYSKQIKDNVVDDKYYKKSVLRKRVIAHVPE